MKEKNTEISARVTEMIERLAETPNSFAKALGYSRAQTIYDIISGKSAPSYDFFRKIAIAEISASINIYWLLTGEGQIFKQPDVDIKKEISTPTDTSLFIDKIAEQAAEIGRLQEQIRQMKIEKGKVASDASTSEIANVG